MANCSNKEVILCDTSADPYVASALPANGANTLLYQPSNMRWLKRANNTKPSPNWMLLFHSFLSAYTMWRTASVWLLAVQSWGIVALGPVHILVTVFAVEKITGFCVTCRQLSYVIFTFDSRVLSLSFSSVLVTPLSCHWLLGLDV